LSFDERIDRANDLDTLGAIKHEINTEIDAIRATMAELDADIERMEAEEQAPEALAVAAVEEPCTVAGDSGDENTATPERHAVPAIVPMTPDDAPRTHEADALPLDVVLAKAKLDFADYSV
jgi:hypothetical protein